MLRKTFGEEGKFSEAINASMRPQRNAAENTRIPG